MDRESLLEMINNPESILKADKKTLKQRIEQQRLTADEYAEAAIDTGKSKGRELVVDILNGSLGSLIFDVIETGDELGQNISDMKKSLVVASYVQKSDDHDKALQCIVDLITDPYGLTLYSKLIEILNDSPADDDTLNVLANVLRNISNDSDLKEHFSNKRVVLSMIAKLSPQALLVLQKANRWPIMKAPNKASITVGGIMNGDNSEYIAQGLLKTEIFNDISITSLGLAIKELEVNGLCFTASGTFGGENTVQETLTDSGKEVYKLIY